MRSISMACLIAGLIVFNLSAPALCRVTFLPTAPIIKAPLMKSLLDRAIPRRTPAPQHRAVEYIRFSA